MVCGVVGGGDLIVCSLLTEFSRTHPIISIILQIFGCFSWGSRIQNVGELVKRSGMPKVTRVL